MGTGQSKLTRGILSRGRREGEDRPTKYKDFGSGYEALKNSTNFFSEHSNSDSWTGTLTSQEYDAIKYYTGNGYNSINKNMYTTPYDEMSPSMNAKVRAMENGLNKFVLEKGIQVTRQCDFKIFGAKSGESMTAQQVKNYILKNQDKDGTLQNDGFLSFGANNHGAAIDGWGVVLHIKVPPSVGAGAYVNPISLHSGSTENEFLFNSLARFKFDTSKIKVGSDGKIHVYGVWKGRGKKQSFKK